MTPKQLAEFEDMKKRLANIESVRNVSFIKELQRRLASGLVAIVDGASTSGTAVAVRNAADDGSETVADEYNGVMNVYQNGVLIGKVGYY